MAVGDTTTQKVVVLYLRMSTFVAILLGVTESEKKTETTGEQPPKATPFAKGDFSAWQLAWELGYTIAIPIVVFALAGRWADKQLETSPWLLLAGVVVSVLISSSLVYRKVKNILK